MKKCKIDVDPRMCYNHFVDYALQSIIESQNDNMKNINKEYKGPGQQSLVWRA